MTMTIEEKAKAYDKALGRMKSWKYDREKYSFVTKII